METRDPMKVYTKQQQIAELAKKRPKMKLTSLNHHIDMEWMREAHRRTRKDGAVGSDGRNSKEYGENLEANLQELMNGAKSGSYRAPPALRVYIPKDKWQRRPIGIQCFEDKILQRAVDMILQPIYEQVFFDCSYGFREGRSAHQALEELWKCIMEMKGCWLIDADIEKFYDTMSHQHLRDFIGQRVSDGVIRRLIGKWLKAGVLEQGRLWYPEQGTAQGSVISPLLSNIYLHEVLDQWFEREVKPRLKGRAFMIRFADDFIAGFELESDARRVREVLAKRFNRYGLKLNEEKTRLIAFHPGKDECFNFVGFTHYWDKSRKGHNIVKRKTMSKRLSRVLKGISQWCRTNRHLPIASQHQELSQKVRGHYAYYGITGNANALMRFRNQVERIWEKWLNRRSNEKSHRWQWCQKLLKRCPLPPIRIVHSIYAANL